MRVADNSADIPKGSGGSEIDPATAATLHKKWTAKVPQGISIGSPSVTRGGKGWMKVSINSQATRCHIAM